MLSYTPLFKVVQTVIKSQAASAIYALLGVATVIAVTRNVSTETFGIYSLFVSTVALHNKFSGFNTYFYYRNAFPTMSRLDALTTLSRYLPFTIKAGSLFAVVAIVFDSFVVNVFDIDEQYVFSFYILLFSNCVLTLLNLEMFRFYQTRGDYVFGLRNLILAKAAFVLFVLVGGYAVGAALSVNFILFGLLISQSVNLAIQLAFDKGILEILSIRWAPFEMKSMVAGLALIPSALFFDGFSFFDRLVVSQNQGFEIAGLYGLASQGVMLSYAIFGGSIISAFYPRLAVMRPSRSDGNYAKTVRLLFTIGVLASLACAAGLTVLSPYLVYIVGESYSGSVVIFQMMSFIPLLLFIQSFLMHISYLRDQIYFSSILYACAFLVLISLNLLLVPSFGYEGAIAAAYISLLIIIAVQAGYLFWTRA